ncbi:uncharacterized protein RSE6_05370 [Rhynchosporium secalis]|uniref:Uncharacterized protein n=1 Tax=Rhynchosporium secalis TaxID=38038 RepID=A0A1E1M7K5_RHYSE|nr:uncharacterized protein RSE6_05370 [Rhynchosporium secalis]
MCWLTESWYKSCSHWGPRQLSTACARGEASASLSGCWENTVLGVKNHDGLCPSCRFRADLTGRSSGSSLLLARENVSEAQTEVSSLNSDESEICVQIPVQIQILVTPPTPTTANFSKPLTSLKRKSFDLEIFPTADQQPTKELLCIQSLEERGILESVTVTGAYKLGPRFGRWYAWRGYK